MAATRTTRDTLYEWVAYKLLPRPWMTTTASRQLTAAWSPEALELGRYIVSAQRKGLTLTEIAAHMQEHWPRR